MRRPARFSAGAVIALLAFAAGPVPGARAEHLGALPQIDGVLEKNGADWNVRATWNIGCDDAQRYGYNVDLIREDTGGAIFVAAEGYGVNKDGTAVAGAYPSLSLPAGTPVHPRIVARCYDEFGHPTREGEARGPTIVIPERDTDGGPGGAGGGGGGANSDPNSPSLPPRCPVALYGSSASETLTGTNADDRLFGLGGNDRILGLDGDDCLVGSLDDDRLSGGDGADLLYGGTEADVLIGGHGPDSYRGGPGDDVLRAADNRREAVICGPGRDLARVDRRDRTESCERVIVR